MISSSTNENQSDGFISNPIVIHLLGAMLCSGIIYFGSCYGVVTLLSEEEQQVIEIDRLQMLCNGAANLRVEHSRLDAQLTDDANSLSNKLSAFPTQSPLDAFLVSLAKCELESATQHLAITPISNTNGKLSKLQLVRVSFAGDYASVCRLLNAVHDQVPFAFPTAIEMRCRTLGNSAANKLSFIEITFHLPYQLNNDVAPPTVARNDDNRDKNPARRKAKT